MPRRLLFRFWLLLALVGLGGSCRDPNPTFVFDAAVTDGAREGGALDGGVTDSGVTDGGPRDGGGQ